MGRALLCSQPRHYLQPLPKDTAKTQAKTKGKLSFNMSNNIHLDFGPQKTPQLEWTMFSIG